jgi:hypothetical protein
MNINTDIITNLVDKMPKSLDEIFMRYETPILIILVLSTFILMYLVWHYKSIGFYDIN